jgi:hypothetical protein
MGPERLGRVCKGCGGLNCTRQDMIDTSGPDVCTGATVVQMTQHETGVPQMMAQLAQDRLKLTQVAQMGLQGLLSPKWPKRDRKNLDGAVSLLWPKGHKIGYGCPNYPKWDRSDRIHTSGPDEFTMNIKMIQMRNVGLNPNSLEIF